MAKTETDTPEDQAIFESLARNRAKQGLGRLHPLIDPLVTVTECKPKFWGDLSW